ncbi:membrane protein insertase YidC [Thiotrichales bacterium 19X7-9]|nr:membrane protein insertase YidC [Thiotrichales bacterium 19X7-9]
MKPNNIRLALLIAIFMVFMIFYSKYYQRFHPQDNVSQTEVAQVDKTNNNNSKIPIQAIPKSPTNLKEDQKSALVNNKADEHFKPIHIKTDVLDLEIKPLNATIVNASLLKYPTSIENKQPLSILTNQNNIDYISQSAVATSTKQKNLYFKSEKLNYQMGSANELSVTLVANNGQLEVTKIYSFKRGSYDISVKTTVKNISNHSLSARTYNFLSRKEPQSGGGLLNVHSYATYIGAVLSSTSDKYQKESFSNIAKSPVNITTTDGWAAMVEHYFLTAWIPQGSGENVLYTQENKQDKAYIAGIIQPQFELAPSQAQSQTANLYIGPAIKDQLEAAAPNLSYTIDYGLLWFISVIVFWAMAHIHEVVGNWGVSIILVTLLIKILFYPLSAKSFRSMAKMRMLQPKIKQLKERLGDDRQKMSQAMMELYRREKVNPLGGCLPILIQIPVFIALYWVLLESVQLRQAPFIFWIQDLSVKDPYYVLPVLMGLSMLVQQKINPAPPDPVQAKVMMFLPVIFTVMFASFPAGLVLYWLTNNILTIVQQSWVNHRIAKDPKFENLKKIKSNPKKTKSK